MQGRECKEGRMQGGQGQQGRQIRQGVIIDGKVEEHGSHMGDTMGGSSREVGMTGMELEDGLKG